MCESLDDLVASLARVNQCKRTLPCPGEADSYRVARETCGVTEGTSRIASDFGLQLNLAPGKTEAVVSWVGAGSRPVRRRLMSLSANRQIAMLPLRTRLGDGGELQIPALSENERAVRIVQAYRHLGTVAMQAGAGMGREIASRANAGQAATHELSRRLLGNEGLPQHVRVQVAKASVASRCLHQAGTWDALEGPQLQRLKVAWCRPWRIIAGAHRPPSPGQRWKSNDAVQKELQVGNLEDELAGM